MTVYAGTNISPEQFDLGHRLYQQSFHRSPVQQNTLPETINVPVPPGYTNITIIMNEFGNPYSADGDAWIYTAGAQITNFQYLVFTEDTNLTTTPIKFALPPFSFTPMATNYVLSDFELATNGDYLAPTNIYDAFGGWSMPTNELDRHQPGVVGRTTWSASFRTRPIRWATMSAAIIWRWPTAQSRARFRPRPTAFTMSLSGIAAPAFRAGGAAKAMPRTAPTRRTTETTVR